MSYKQVIGSFEAKTHLSEILKKVSEEGFEYTVTKHGKAIAVITPYLEKKKTNISKFVKEFIKYRNKLALSSHRKKKSLREMMHQEKAYL
jgi:prevent-host-death family protein